MYLYLRYQQAMGYVLPRPLVTAFAFDVAVAAALVWILT